MDDYRHRVRRVLWGGDTVMGNVDTELMKYAATVCQELGVTVHSHPGGLLGIGFELGRN